MQINFNNNINFKGGFRLPQINQAGKELLDSLPKRGKQIFYDFEKPGDVFLVTRDTMDLKIARFIKTHNIDCEYYPEINTNGGFDDQIPEVLSEALKGKNFETINRVRKYRRKEAGGRVKVIDPNDKEIKPDVITTILNKLFIIADNITIKNHHSAKIIESPESNKIVNISRANKKNVHYVFIDSTTPNVSRERYAIKSNGRIVGEFNKPEGIKIFDNLYNLMLQKN